MDDTDPCLYKGRTSVLSNPTVIARRKRMEIRRFKKLSGSTQLLHDKLNPLAENRTICIKRARIERATTTGSFSDPLETDGTLSFTSYTEEGFFALCKGKEAAKRNGHGLHRYKSLSPYVDGAQEFCLETDVYDGAMTTKEEQLCNSLTGNSRDQKAESDSALPEVVCSTSFGAAPSSIVEEIGNPQSESTLDTLFPSTASVLSSQELLENSSVISDLIVSTSDVQMADVDNKTTGIVGPEVLSSSDIAITSLRDGSCPHSGKLLVCGRRREMEDTATIAPFFSQLQRGTSGSHYCAEKVEDGPLCNLHFFAVYDGHGGSQASKYCMERLHHALAEEMSSLSLASEIDCEASKGSFSSCVWEKAMSSCFSKVDQEVGGVCPSGQCDDVGGGSATCCGDSIAPENVGTTAIVAVVSSCQIVVANCGDSRAVLSRGGEAIPLSRDHKPERDDETSRIEAAGGRVIYWDGYRVGGLLALSRSIGDRYLKRYVVSEPEVTCLQRTDDDECLILASDGLWDVISNDTACEIARKCLDSSRKKRASGCSSLGEDPASASAAALLVKLAYSRGSKDNISVVVIDLKS